MPGHQSWHKPYRDAASGRGGIPSRRRRVGHRVRPGDSVAVERHANKGGAYGGRVHGMPRQARKRALRPVGCGGRSTVRLHRTLPLATRIRNAPHGSPSGYAPLTPPVPRERLHSMAQRFAIISPCRASRALASAPFDGCTHSPSLCIRSQARCRAPCLQDTDSCAHESTCPAPVRRGDGRTARYGSLPPEGNRLAADSPALSA